MNNKVISQLPVILQTDTQKKFFEATFEQLFQKKDVNDEVGYIGRRVGGRYDPEHDYFLAESTFDRNNYQLEPIAYSKDPDTLDETNVMFYEDFLNYIQQHNGLIDNHDRLFKTNSYSFAPPINADMFINYQNYMFLVQDLPTIPQPNLYPVDVEGKTNFAIFSEILTEQNASADIIAVLPGVVNVFEAGQDFIALGVEPGYAIQIAEKVYEITGVEAEELQLNADISEFSNIEGVEYLVAEKYLDVSSGMHLTLGDDQEYIVEGVGCSIYLVKPPTQLLPFNPLELLQWDNEAELWDELPWDAQNVGVPYDYVTMQRGSVDGNAWSRTNRWYHRDIEQF